ncbi:MCM2/3/5 family-domain-containing protein [Catenaria anguillulae PL171]|uniref:DNA replication licensing factor MCM7 n=1 Tax=Catenaria anguillulae PL171 TaxID=765915 RepID=A0A1Y2I074_9FUNG|nr:MCM2/3/5 family-domain-containing protein [Catenaria anguillulae PL171]
MATAAFNINFEKEKELIEDFLLTFKTQAEVHQDGPFDNLQTTIKYLDTLGQVADRNEDSVRIQLDDVFEFNDDLCQRIKQNTKRYVDLFSQVIDKIMPVPTNPLSKSDTIIDVIIHHRQAMEAQVADDGSQPVQFPASLKRRYSVFFVPQSKHPSKAVRDIKAQHIGQLVQLRGIITRVSDVKPLLTVCTYSCDVCGCEVFQEVKARSVTPLQQCQSQFCTANRARGKLHMQVRASKFLRFQEAKIQELADQVPMGHIPRTMTVHLYEGLTRSVNTGDIVTIAGIFLPTPYTGYKALRAGLLADTYLDAMHVEQTKKTYDVMANMADADQVMAQIHEKLHGHNVYEVLANSICPEIYGMEDVKKALLLLLVGGVTKKVGDGMKIRGDINVLLMGDPGVAKSQLLKWTSKVAPRGVYTTGKGSSGVGLTAAVMKDAVTGEMVLEGGALVLADNGICCIDEFDKMEDGDKTAIHEVMEQQTISISKAGIVTTLNARASILAAANPVYGRYNTALSPNQNINLPAALLSRFDIVFLLLDTPDMDNDVRLAQHVTQVHMLNQAPEKSDQVLLTEEEMRVYISQAVRERPIVPAAVGEYMTNVYVGIRKEEARQPTDYGYTTARTLVSILRMSQALCRLRFSSEVSVGDVDEALRLMSVSKQSLSDKRSGKRKRGENPTTAIFNLLKQMVGAEEAAATVGGAGDEDDDMETGEVPMSELRERVIAKGMTEAQLEDMLREYTELGVLYVTADRSKVRIM